MTTTSDAARVALIDMIADRLPGPPPGVTRSDRHPWACQIAATIEAHFHLIPADQCEPVIHEYSLPSELVEDAAAVEHAHTYIRDRAVAAALANGLLIVSHIKRRPIPPPVRMANMRTFRLTATGWRIPTQEPPT